METAKILDLSVQALQVVFILSLPTVIVSAVVGLIVAFLEAVTQIQEQSIGMGAKILAVLVTIMLSAHWAGGVEYNFADRLFGMIPAIGAGTHE